MSFLKVLSVSHLGSRICLPLRAGVRLDDCDSLSRISMESRATPTKQLHVQEVNSAEVHNLRSRSARGFRPLNAEKCS